MCRAGGRRCPIYTDPEKIKERNARRRAAYKANKASKGKKFTPSDFKNVENSVNETQVKVAEPVVKVNASDEKFVANILDMEENLFGAAPGKKKVAVKKPSVKKTAKIMKKEESDPEAELTADLTNTVTEKEEPVVEKVPPVDVPEDNVPTVEDVPVVEDEPTVDVSKVVELSPAGKAKTKKIYSGSVEMKKDFDDKNWNAPTKKYTAASLFKTTGLEEYNPQLNIDLKEHSGVLVDIGYFNKKSVSGVLDYTKLGSESSDAALGFVDFEKVDGGNLKLDLYELRSKINQQTLRGIGEAEVKDLSADDRTALNYFTSNSYEWVNQALFNREVSDVTKYSETKKKAEDMTLTEAIGSYDHHKEVLKNIANHLDEALTKGKKQQRTLYRGVKGYADFLRDENGNKIEASQWVDKNLKVGGEIVFDGYQSATPAAEGLGAYSSDDGIIYEIITPEGVNVESITAFSGECEVTLPRQARYTVASITKNVDVQINSYGTRRDNTVVRLIAINSKGEVLDGTNSDPVEPITDEYFKKIH